MSILYGNLKNIYQNSREYTTQYSIDEIYPLIRLFLIKKIELSEQYLDPYEFSNIYKINSKFSVEIFLALSKESTFKKYYYIECDSCSNSTISDDIKEIVECQFCGNILNVSERNSIIQKVRFVFVLEESIREELIFDLKARPSSVSDKNHFEDAVEGKSNFSSIDDNNEYPETDTALKNFENELKSIMKRV